MAALTFVIGKLMKLNRRMLAAVILTTMTINAGNYGLSLNLFAFGEPALAHASIFYAVTALATYTLGVAVASMGTVSFKESLIRLLKDLCRDPGAHLHVPKLETPLASGTDHNNAW